MYGCGKGVEGGGGSYQVIWREEREANLNFSLVNFSAHSEDLNFEVKKYFFTPNEVKKYFFTPNEVKNGSLSHHMVNKLYFSFIQV